MRVSSTLPRPTLLALLLPLTLLTSPHLQSTVDARAIDVSERALGREPHTPYADPSRPPADGLQYWGDSSSSNAHSQEVESRSAKSSRTEGLFSMNMDIEGEDQDDDDELDEDLDDYFWDGSSSSSSSSSSSTSQMDRAGRDVDPYRITIEPQYYSQDLFDYREEDDDDEVEENEGEDGFRSGGINMITRFREEIEEAFDEENEDEDEDMDMGAIDDEGDYVGFWHGDRRSSRSHRRRRQGLGLSLRGSTGGSNHGRQSWKINDNDWEEDLDGVLSLEDMVDRVQDVEHVRASSAAKTKEGAGGFRRLFPHNW